MQLEATIATLYTSAFGTAPKRLQPLRADGSNRRIWRVGHTDHSAIAVFGPDTLENNAFLSFTDSFRSLGLPVPEIYARDLGAGVYLEEDLGDVTLLGALESSRVNGEIPESTVMLFRRSLEMLARMQVEGGRHINFDDAYPVAEFDRRAMLWDLNYFKYNYLKLAGVDFHEARLEDDFDALTGFLLRADRRHFVYRDFNPRNIMVRDHQPWFIDYQGGRRGAVHYDVASLLYSSKASLPETLRDELREHYVTALGALIEVDRGEFNEQYRGYVLLRVLQLLGAYGYRGYFERKQHFLDSIPHALRNIRAMLDDDAIPLELPELRAILERIVSSADQTSSPTTPDGSASVGSTSARSAGKPVAPLTVTVRSFSYKQGGYPEEPGSHGGGFVFDVRALHNPGRYDEYKQLSGLDPSVVSFLEREQAVESFFANVWDLVSSAVQAYLERGFDSLAVSFGCTGGQHRSVYFAERLARSLRTTFPGVVVEVSHRESQRWPQTGTNSAATS